MFTISIAGFNIGIDNRYSYVEALAADYQTQTQPLFTVKATQQAIDMERKNDPERHFSDAYLEAICIYRSIALVLPTYQAFVLHAAAISVDGKAYLFAAPSGVGKTTHIRLWRKRFGEKVQSINGDKPIIRLLDGAFYACGTPWRGKEEIGKPRMAQIAGLCFLERAAKNHIETMPPETAAVSMLRQSFLPPASEAFLATLTLLDGFCKTVPMYRLLCNTEASAAETAYRKMVGEIGLDEKEPSTV